MTDPSRRLIDCQAIVDVTEVQPVGAPYHARFLRQPPRWRIAERTLCVAGEQEFDGRLAPVGRTAVT